MEGGKVMGSKNDLLVKNKRGRPRKYDSNGNFIRRPNVSSSSLSLSSSFNHLLSLPPLPPTIRLTPSKRGREQPIEAAHHQFPAMGDLHTNTTGMELKPYVIEVSFGEDIIQKMLAQFQTGPKCVSIVSAIGTVYNVVIRRPGSSSSAHLVKYEGQFEILNLSGSYTICEDGKIQTDGFSVLLARTDGHIIGGTLANSLLAASTVQLVLGSFVPAGNKKQPKKRHQYGLRKLATSHVHHDPEATTSKKPILPRHKCQATTLHEAAPIHGEANDGGTSYNMRNQNPTTTSLLPSWNLQPSPDLNADASME